MAYIAFDEEHTAERLLERIEEIRERVWVLHESNDHGDIWEKTRLWREYHCLREELKTAVNLPAIRRQAPDYVTGCRITSKIGALTRPTLARRVSEFSIHRCNSSCS